MNHLTKHIAAIAAIGCIQGCTAVKTVVHNFADLDDHRIFDNRAIAPAAVPEALRTLPRVPAFISTLQVPNESGGSRPSTSTSTTRALPPSSCFGTIASSTSATARGFDTGEQFNSFSIAKSIHGDLVGIAVAEAKHRSLDATVADYRPDFAASAYGAYACATCCR
jgi:hypothetical protein